MGGQDHRGIRAQGAHQVRATRARRRDLIENEGAENAGQSVSTLSQKEEEVSRE